MSTSATNSLSLFNVSPFPNADIFEQSSKYFFIGDLVDCAKVCKAWNKFMHSPFLAPFWLSVFDEKKIPRIEGREANAMEDFLFMYPITYSADKMACLGKFVGMVPMISAKAFEMLKSAKDPFSPRNKVLDFMTDRALHEVGRNLNFYNPFSHLSFPIDIFIKLIDGNHVYMNQTFRVIVEPEFIHRNYDEKLLGDLFTEGDFVLKSSISVLKQEGLLIPFSLKKPQNTCQTPRLQKKEFFFNKPY